MKVLKIGNRQITTLADLYLHVLKPQSSGLDAASNNVGHSLTGKQTGLDTLIGLEVGIAEKLDMGREAKSAVSGKARHLVQHSKLGHARNQTIGGSTGRSGNLLNVMDA
jgi:hypothetical protein